ncbi:MAG: hypothetical protein HPY74_19615 [Firmicutes bacterium]|nr:hypothetical protein [Bacillota bacterium]
MIRWCVEENAHLAMDQAEYEKHYEGLLARYEKAKVRLDKVKEVYQNRRIKRAQLDAFLSRLFQKDLVLSEFGETLWHAVIDKITVYSENDIQFTFSDGTVIRV